MSVDKCFHLLQVSLLGFLARFDDHLVAPFAVMLSHRKLSDCEAKKIEAYAAFVFVKRVCDVGLAGFQGQSHFS